MVEQHRAGMPSLQPLSHGHLSMVRLPGGAAESWPFLRLLPLSFGWVRTPAGAWLPGVSHRCPVKRWEMP